ncbi:MAG TPA: aminoglycoside phosphotransferase family protein [Anaerolineales bacterium]|nr:aminoglycoside phosphotransferase family protein [Anaerolineales bacterium]
MNIASAAPSRTTWPWPFTRSDLTAGLRRLLKDPTIQVGHVRAGTLPFHKPAIGRVRGLAADYVGRQGAKSILLAVKEAVGTTRIGLAGVGRREVGVYRYLVPQGPLRAPRLVAASPAGHWLILEAVPLGKNPARWTRTDYKNAINSLANLHDQFWGLRDDLSTFPWLSRPLEADFDVHLAAAAHAIQYIVEHGTPASIARAPARLELLARLTARADDIAAPLRSQPPTLLHGDYWAGNIAVQSDGAQVVYDWQLTAVGPAILDLVNFVKKSEWWFGTLPLSASELAALYRSQIAQQPGFTWTDEEWERLWDHALLWRFVQEWLDLLAAMPEALLLTSSEQLDKIWLDPVEAAFRRRLGGR